MTDTASPGLSCPRCAGSDGGDPSRSSIVSKRFGRSRLPFEIVFRPTGGAELGDGARAFHAHIAQTAKPCAPSPAGRRAGAEMRVEGHITSKANMLALSRSRKKRTDQN